MGNPWLKIPAKDYEGHMGSPEVAQSQMISEVFGNTLKTYKPDVIAVPGCATGNGFEKINWEKVRHLDAIDVNPDFLKIAEARFEKYKDKISFKCMDLQKEKLEENKYDLIFAALIFEYVPAEILFSTFHNALKKDGILSVILQMGSESHPAVSETMYKSLEQLSAVLHPLTPDNFLKTAKKFGFNAIRKNFIKLDSGKEFYHSHLTIKIK